MKKDNKPKENILKGVKRKLRIRDMKIVGISIASIMIIGLIIYYIGFHWHHPLKPEQFSNVYIERVTENIMEMDPRDLTYNHLHFTTDHPIWYTIIDEKMSHFYIENNDDFETTTLYFYLSETYVQRYQNKKFRQDRIKFMKSSFTTEEEYKKAEESGFLDDSETMDFLISTTLCNADIETITKEITKVYYLVYDYDDMNPEKFKEAKKDAVLLWKKNE